MADEIERLREEYATLNGTAIRIIDDQAAKLRDAEAERDALAARLAAAEKVVETAIAWRKAKTTIAIDNAIVALEEAADAYLETHHG